jgi:TetR/AcrR family transcriptional regulator, mexJK operon transcriptional repressor
MKSRQANSKRSATKGGVAVKDRSKAVKPQPPLRLYQAGRPTSAELERRKAKVMDVATSLFVQHGYSATSLVDIAKSAGVATRTLYQHFGDKEAIFLEVVTARETGAVFPHPAIDDDVCLFDGLMQIAHYICDVALRPRSVDLMRLAVAESRRFPEFMKELCQMTFTRFRANVALMFDELTERGIAPVLDSKTSAALFADLVLGSTPLLTYAGWLSSKPTEAELETKVELFIVGRFGQVVADRAREPTLLRAGGR